MTPLQLLLALAATTEAPERLMLIEEFGDERYNDGYDDGYRTGYNN
jgi:hypothetical protein